MAYPSNPTWEKVGILPFLHGAPVTAKATSAKPKVGGRTQLESEESGEGRNSVTSDYNVRNKIIILYSTSERSFGTSFAISLVSAYDAPELGVRSSLVAGHGNF